ncbi:glucose dehydrogenase [FAD, quinone]-like [Galleria mellonella]|uniref:Glucose dehydrogenase [FAD, quinone]-like n=1 Tax=Galleria mellonella TaxID=7137 RepID=A0A6J3C063_GALME|nr:glucose dehydrogenase [FAD, quinone]-like [Galleria mellonella]
MLVLLLLSVLGAARTAGALLSSYSLPPGVTLTDGEEFEYIVVGAGAAGAVVASRLALAGANVLLVEAGGDPSFISRIPAVAMALMGSEMDYRYETISNNVSCLSSKDRACLVSRGKCLGGSTSINHMMYIRGNREDYDALNITDWSWRHMEPYFLRYEGLQDLDHLPISSIPYHNTTGTMKLGFFEYSNNPWHLRIINGYEALNFPCNLDVNGVSQIGVSRIIGYTYNNERMSTARGYLGRDDVKRKLKVAKYTRCTGVIIDDDNVARGITVVHGPSNATLRLYASREVILSAGALVTPQLLMLSGIGPADHLNEMGIPVRVDLPVGNNMTDHTLVLVVVKVEKETNLLRGIIDSAGKIFSLLADILISRGRSLGSIGLNDVTTFVNTLCYDFDKRQLTKNSTKCELSTTQFIHQYAARGLLVIGGPILKQRIGLAASVINQLSEINKNYALVIISSLVLQPKSSGTIRLASVDPLQAPAIFPNYLSDERDVDEMVRGIQIIEQLTETLAFKTAGASLLRLELEGCPSSSRDLTAYWRCYARHLTYSTFHSVGTSALGRVLDTRMRVRGVARLRVADAGALPQLPRGNPAAAVIALGERLADFLLDNNGD